MVGKDNNLTFIYNTLEILVTKQTKVTNFPKNVWKFWTEWFRKKQINSDFFLKITKCFNLCVSVRRLTSLSVTGIGTLLNF